MKISFMTFLSISLLLLININCFHQVEAGSAGTPDLSACSKFSKYIYDQTYDLNGTIQLAIFDDQTLGFVNKHDEQPETVYDINDPSNPEQICQFPDSVEDVVILKDIKGKPRYLIVNEVVNNVSTKTLQQISSNNPCLQSSVSGQIDSTPNYNNYTSYIIKVGESIYWWRFNQGQGYQVLDITSLENIQQVAQNDTKGLELNDFFFWQNQHWAYFVHMDQEENIFVSFKDIANPVSGQDFEYINNYELQAQAVVEYNKNLYLVLQYAYTTRIYDINNPFAPKFIKHENVDGELDVYDPSNFQIGAHHFIQSIFYDDPQSEDPEENTFLLDVSDPFDPYYVRGLTNLELSSLTYFSTVNQTFFEVAGSTIAEYNLKCHTCKKGYQLADGKCFSQGKI